MTFDEHNARLGKIIEEIKAKIEEMRRVNELTEALYVEASGHLAAMMMTDTTVDDFIDSGDDRKAHQAELGSDSRGVWGRSR